MKIDGKNYKKEIVFKNMMTVPDCIVSYDNKIGTGHGEAKFYIASKEEMYAFYGKRKFNVKCVMLKEDLISYMEAIKEEYMHPSQNYRKKSEMPKLWIERMKMIKTLDDYIFFDIMDQYQITGPRGYINSRDDGYQIIREIALPFVSYIYSEKMVCGNVELFYWRLFVDFDVMKEKKSIQLVLKYGKGIEEEKEIKVKESRSSKNEAIRQARDGQGKYREGLLKQCKYCPITHVSDDRLLIASHIKPWAASNDKEKIDPYNGFLLSPLYDKLFDRGFITFTNKKHMIISEVISSYNWKLLKVDNDVFIRDLPLDDKRLKYLDYHHKSVFKGNYKEKVV